LFLGEIKGFPAQNSLPKMASDEDDACKIQGCLPEMSATCEAGLRKAEGASVVN